MCCASTPYGGNRSGQLHPSKLVSHRFAMDDIMTAYDVFGNAANEGALKVGLKTDGTETDSHAS